LGSAQGEPPNVRDTSKKFFFELSAATVPENEHPELDPFTFPLELMVTVVEAPLNREPVQLPEMSASDAGVL
jgi:hypothetical protein